MRKIKGYQFIDCQNFTTNEDDSPREFGCWSGILTIYDDGFFMGVVSNANTSEQELVLGHLLASKVVSLTKFNYENNTVVPELYDNADPDQNGALYSGNYIIFHDFDDLDMGYSYITLHDLEPSVTEQSSIGENLAEALQEFAECKQPVVQQLYQSLIEESPEDTADRLKFTYYLYSCANPELADACIADFMLQKFLGAEAQIADLNTLLSLLPQLSDQASSGTNENGEDLGTKLANLGLIEEDTATDESIISQFVGADLDEDDGLEMTNEEIEEYVADLNVGNETDANGIAPPNEDETLASDQLFRK